MRIHFVSHGETTNTPQTITRYSHTLEREQQAVAGVTPSSRHPPPPLLHLWCTERYCTWGWETRWLEQAWPTPSLPLISSKKLDVNDQLWLVRVVRKPDTATTTVCLCNSFVRQRNLDWISREEMRGDRLWSYLISTSPRCPASAPSTYSSVFASCQENKKVKGQHISVHE